MKDYFTKYDDEKKYKCRCCLLNCCTTVSYLLGDNMLPDYTKEYNHVCTDCLSKCAEEVRQEMNRIDALYNEKDKYNQSYLMSERQKANNNIELIKEKYKL